MKYLKIFVEFADYMEELDDAERGRLFTAMLRYARDGEAPALSGNERFLWAVAREQLDRMAEQYRKTCAANAANARKKADAEGPFPVRPDAAGEAEATSAPEKAASVQAEAAPVREPVVFAREGAGAPMERLAFRPPDLSLAQLAQKAGKLPREPYPPPVEVVLPLARNDGLLIYPNKIEEWGRRFPGVDVKGELRKMRDWLGAHPERVLARKDAYPFVLRWLEKAGKARRPSAPPREPPSYDIEEIKSFITANSGG